MSRPKRNEQSILERIEQGGAWRPRTGPQSLRLGIGDDAALFIPARGCELVLTADWFLEGTHFRRSKHPADSVGWKCLARAVSDVAAMGGVPRCFLLSLALPESLTGTWLDQFLAGLRRASQKLNCPLAGGDTTKSARVLINVTVVGEVQSGVAKRRTGARPGDSIYVSGTLGEAEAGWQTLQASKQKIPKTDRRLQKHYYPAPRISLGRWLVTERNVSSMMDLSDGLSADLLRLCTASGVGARIELSQLPLSSIARTSKERSWALHGGEDYELLFTAPQNQSEKFLGFPGTPLTRIGTITRTRRLLVVHRDGSTEKLVPRGWDPFRARK